MGAAGFVPFDEILLHFDQAGGGAWFGVKQAESSSIASTSSGS